MEEKSLEKIETKLEAKAEAKPKKTRSTDWKQKGCHNERKNWNHLGSQERSYFLCITISKK